MPMMQGAYDEMTSDERSVFLRGLDTLQTFIGSARAALCGLEGGGDDSMNTELTEMTALTEQGTEIGADDGAGHHTGHDADACTDAQRHAADDANDGADRSADVHDAGEHGKHAQGDRAQYAAYEHTGAHAERSHQRRGRRRSKEKYALGDEARLDCMREIRKSCIAAGRSPA